MRIYLSKKTQPEGKNWEARENILAIPPLPKNDEVRGFLTMQRLLELEDEGRVDANGTPVNICSFVAIWW